MWRKFMHSWLIGAAITMASPEIGLAAESGDAATETVSSREDTRDAGPTRQPAGHEALWSSGEPTLDEMLADPIVHVLMTADGVTSVRLLALVDETRSRLR